MPKHYRRKFACTVAALLALLLAASAVPANAVPLPRPRPADAGGDFRTATGALGGVGPVSELSACARRLRGRALFTPLPEIDGPGECGAGDVVRLAAIVIPARVPVSLDPPATLTCQMAEAVAEFVRSDLAVIAGDLSAPLKAVAVSASYDCRPRNRAPGTKMSEHGRANALDISALRLANGTAVMLAGPAASPELGERVRVAACRYFTTVLGPGADSHHNDHIHLDRIERRGGYRLCQWDVRAPQIMASVPLPPRKPGVAAATAAPRPQPRPPQPRHK